jgi:Holliday junction resolvase RusA-like endonuclease
VPRSKFGKPYYPKTYKKWRDDANAIVPEWGGTPIDFPVKVTVLFAIPRARTSQLIVPMGDVDNLEKALYDLLQSKKYLLDDKFITTVTARKRFLPFGATGWSAILIEAEDDALDYQDV